MTIVVMSKKRIHSLIVLLTVSVTISCGGLNRELSEAERLLETDPLKADSLLSSISVPESKRMRALYAILRQQFRGILRFYSAAARYELPIR